MTLRYHEGDVVANGVRLHYYRTGGAKPAVVLSHGYTDSGLCWSPLARDLAADYDVLMYDLRAHGRSEVPESGYSADDRAADLIGLVSALGLERPALIGHSMGAETTAYAAAAAPDLPSCVVLEDPPFGRGFYAAALADREEQAALMRVQVTERRRLSTEQILAGGRATNPHWSEDDLIPWAGAKRQVHPNAAYRRRDAPAVSWRETLPRIVSPTLLLTADVERGGLITSAVADEIVSILPDGHVVNIAEAGHSIRRDRYANYLAAVRAFLAEHV
jgi:N-formylmaleamate deformylase